MINMDYTKSYILGRIYQIRKRVGGGGLQSYNGVKILKGESADECLVKAIESGNPFMAGRFGATECSTFVRYLEMEMGIRKDFGPWMDAMTLYSGFFPKREQDLKQYCEMIKDVYGAVDILAPMGTLGERYVIKKYCSNPVLIDLGTYDPFCSWVRSLKGKKILVIHPFINTIKKQYEHIEKIYPGGEVPRFSLEIIKAVQSIGGENNRYLSWFDALESMKKQIETKDFDIALVGCGAYGFPLAVHIKRMGRQAVHIGGALQLFFGIKGKRWENQEYVRKYINEYWVNPSEEETPSVSEKIEGGCYW